MENLENLLQNHIPDCLEHYDGIYYATEEGCEKLAGILNDHGHEVIVTVSSDHRFDVKKRTAAQKASR